VCQERISVPEEDQCASRGSACQQRISVPAEDQRSPGITELYQPRAR